MKTWKELSLVNQETQVNLIEDRTGNNSLEYAYFVMVCFLLPQLPAKKLPELPYDDCLIIVRYNQLVLMTSRDP